MKICKKVYLKILPLKFSYIKKFIRYLESPEFSRQFGIIFTFEKVQVYKLVDENLKKEKNIDLEYKIFDQSGIAITIKVFCPIILSW